MKKENFRAFDPEWQTPLELIHQPTDKCVFSWYVDETA